jgi:hypothetical protein
MYRLRKSLTAYSDLGETRAYNLFDQVGASYRDVS